MSKTLTKADLAESIYQNVGLTRKESSEMVDCILQHMSDALVQGEYVKIWKFGTFTTRNKKQRIGRNPKTGVEAVITPRRTLGFKASNMLKAKINEI